MSKLEISRLSHKLFTVLNAEFPLNCEGEDLYFHSNLAIVIAIEKSEHLGKHLGRLAKKLSNADEVLRHELYNYLLDKDLDCNTELSLLYQAGEFASLSEMVANAPKLENAISNYLKLQEVQTCLSHVYVLLRGAFTAFQGSLRVMTDEDFILPSFDGNQRKFSREMQENIFDGVNITKLRFMAEFEKYCERAVQLLQLQLTGKPKVLKIIQLQDFIQDLKLRVNEAEIPQTAQELFSLIQQSKQNASRANL